MPSLRHASSIAKSRAVLPTSSRASSALKSVPSPHSLSAAARRRPTVGQLALATAACRGVRRCPSLARSRAVASSPSWAFSAFFFTGRCPSPSDSEPLPLFECALCLPPGARRRPATASRIAPTQRGLPARAPACSGVRLPASPCSSTSTSRFVPLARRCARRARVQAASLQRRRAEWTRASSLSSTRPEMSRMAAELSPVSLSLSGNVTESLFVRDKERAASNSVTTERSPLAAALARASLSAPVCLFWNTGRGGRAEWRRSASTGVTVTFLSSLTSLLAARSTSSSVAARQNALLPTVTK
mmetsp:Transcript_19594/g.75217  ORF Transcript_19594/g.75217 Transcript_19594/m.75217 type:complete len:302 (-) Transcript_19594:538-1443(-)